MIDISRRCPLPDQDRGHTQLFCGLQVLERILDHHTAPGGNIKLAQHPLIGIKVRLGLIVRHPDIKNIVEHPLKSQSCDHPLCMAPRTVGKNVTRHGQLLDGVSQRQIRAESPGDIDIMDIVEIIFRINLVMTDQPLQGGTIILPIAPTQTINFGSINPDDLLHVVINAHVNQREQITLRRIQRVVEVKQNGIHNQFSRAARISRIRSRQASAERFFSSWASLQIGRGQSGSDSNRGIRCQCMCGTMFPSNS